jgi:hypothetical protein
MTNKTTLVCFGIAILLTLSGFVSAYVDYGAVNTREDVRIYTYEPREESVQVIYKQPSERVFFYQVGTYAETYGNFNTPSTKSYYEPTEHLNQVVYQRPGFSSRIRRVPCENPRNIISCDGSYHLKLYWFDW